MLRKGTGKGRGLLFDLGRRLGVLSTLATCSLALRLCPQKLLHNEDTRRWVLYCMTDPADALRRESSLVPSSRASVSFGECLLHCMPVFWEHVERCFDSRRKALLCPEEHEDYVKPPSYTTRRSSYSKAPTPALTSRISYRSKNALCQVQGSDDDDDDDQELPHPAKKSRPSPELEDVVVARKGCLILLYGTVQNK